MMQNNSQNDASKQDGAYCASCGRYVGAYIVCPYCGARLKERLSVRALKLLSLFIAIVGVLIIWWVAGNRMVPKIKVGEIDNRTNFAYAQVKGFVTRTPTIDDKTKALSFQIDDGTGTLWIKSYGAQTEELLELGKIPKPGDTILVEGTVRLKGDFTYVTINLPDKLQIIEQKPLELDISELSDSLYGTVVKTAGVVNSIRIYDESKNIQLCSPNTDICIEMNIYYSTFPSLSAASIARGDTIALVAMMSSYKSKLQLVPRSEDEFWWKHGSIPAQKWSSGAKPPISAKKVNIGSITKDIIGKYVIIEGTIESVKQIKGGVLVKMNDGSGKNIFPIWDRILETVPNSERLVKGATISFTGKIEEYKGDFQVVPTYGPGVKIISGKVNKEKPPKTSVAETAPVISEIKDELPPKVKLLELTDDYISKIVTVEGEITRVKSIKGGILITFRDGDEYMLTPFWSNILDGLDSEQIKKGAHITITGKVKEYKGKLEVIPGSPEDVKIN